MPDARKIWYSTSTTVNVIRNVHTVGLTLLIVLRLTLIAGMGPPDMAAIFFEQIRCLRAQRERFQAILAFWLADKVIY